MWGHFKTRREIVYDEIMSKPAASSSNTNEQQPPNMTSCRSLIINIPIPPQLEMSGNKDQIWRNWKQLFDSYEIASGLAQQDRKYKVAMLITCIGAEALQVYNNLPFNCEEDKNTIEKILELMGKHCVGELNVIYEVQI